MPRTTIRQARVSAKIDECIVELFGREWRKKSGLTAENVKDCFKKKHPELFAECAELFADRFITDVASSRLRAGGAVLRAANAKVLLLPGLADTIATNLPPLITIPGKDSNKEIHKPLTHALVGEVRAYYQLLKKQLEQDQVRFNAVDFLCRALIDQPEDLRVSDAWKAAMKAGVS